MANRATANGSAGAVLSADEPRTARREATRQRILDAARVVFAEKGVFGASIEDICEQAGFTRGAVYSNFADKDDIVVAVIEREHDRLIEHITGSFGMVDEEIAAAPSLEAAIATLVNRIIRSMPGERQLMLIATELEINAVRRPDLAATFLSANLRFRERLTEMLEEAMTRVGLRPTVAPLDLIDAAMAISEKSVRRALLEGPDADPDSLSEAILPPLILALAAPATPAS